MVWNAHSLPCPGGKCPLTSAPKPQCCNYRHATGCPATLPSLSHLSTTISGPSHGSVFPVCLPVRKPFKGRCCQVYSAMFRPCVLFLGLSSKSRAVHASKWIPAAQVPALSGEQIEFALMVSRLLICLNQLNDRSGIVFSAC